MLVELDENTYINVLHVTHVQTSFVERSVLDKNSVGQVVNSNKNQVEVVDIFLGQTPIQIEGVTVKEVVEVLNKGLMMYEKAVPIKAFLMVLIGDSYVNAVSVTHVINGEVEEAVKGKGSGLAHSMKKIPGAEIGGTGIFVKGMTAKEVSGLLNKKLKELF
jgi:hypothetical protein